MIYDTGTMGKVWEGRTSTAYDLWQLWNYYLIDHCVSFYNVHAPSDCTVTLLLRDSRPSH